MKQEKDLYLILGIENGGPEVSQLEVRKSYRARALTCHPDKRRQDATAALDFHELQKAYHILGDEKAKKEYDELWKVRRRPAEKSKRETMMRDARSMRERDRAFEMGRRQKRREEETVERLKEEIARFLAMHARKQTPAESGFSFDSEANSSTRPQAAAATPAQADEMERTLKASWSREEGGGGGYTVARLTEIFQEFGAVEHIVISRRKSKRKGSALVVKASKEAASAVIDVRCGDLSNPILVTPVVSTSNCSAEPVKVQASIIPPWNVKTTVSCDYRYYENEILVMKKKAAERQRIIKEMEEADARAV